MAITTTYDQGGLTYDQVAYLYDGFLLVDPVTLLVAGDTVIPSVLNQTMKVRQSTTEGQQGTLDAELWDSTPAQGASVALWLGTTTAQQLFSGSVASTTVKEIPITSHTQTQLSAQDTGAALGAPTTAPWNVSDAPNFSTTFPYESLSKQTRTIDGAVSTSYVLVLTKQGLWRNMNIQVTSARLGLAAQTFTIVDAQAEFPTDDLIRYSLTLNDPVIQLSELVSGIANEVANDSAEVFIDENGLRVLNGAISVENQGAVVIIDGTSDMFRIVATGTIYTAGFTNPANPGAVQTVNLPLGFSYRPAHAVFVTVGSVALGTPHLIVDNGGVVLDWYVAWVEQAGADTQVRVQVASSRGSGDTNSAAFRYYIYEQVSI